MRLVVSNRAALELTLRDYFISSVASTEHRGSENISRVEGLLMVRFLDAHAASIRVPVVATGRVVSGPREPRPVARIGRPLFHLPWRRHTLRRLEDSTRLRRFQFTVAPVLGTRATERITSEVRGQLAPSTRPPAACADAAPAAWGDPQDGPNHVGIALTRSPVANRWRRAAKTLAAAPPRFLTAIPVCMIRPAPRDRRRCLREWPSLEAAGNRRGSGRVRAAVNFPAARAGPPTRQPRWGAGLGRSRSIRSLGYSWPCLSTNENSASARRRESTSSPFLQRRG
jgi:hypothetical protein